MRAFHLIFLFLLSVLFALIFPLALACCVSSIREAEKAEFKYRKLTTQEQAEGGRTRYMAAVKTLFRETMIKYISNFAALREAARCSRIDMRNISNVEQIFFECLSFPFPFSCFVARIKSFRRTLKIELRIENDVMFFSIGCCWCSTSIYTQCTMNHAGEESENSQILTETTIIQVSWGIFFALLLSFSFLSQCLLCFKSHFTLNW